MKLKSILFLGSLSMLACTPTENVTDIKGEVVDNLTNHVVIPTYSDLHNAAKNLNAAVQKLEVGNEEALTEARNAWSNARNFWEQTEAFLFGPVDFEEIDPALDSWPVDLTAINGILSESKEITEEIIQSNPEARGFHLIEFLLWGENQNKKAADFNAHEIQYLKVAAQDFEQNTQRLHASWVEGDQPFKLHLLNAGQEPSNYDSTSDVIQEFTEGVIGLLDEVANAKIAAPLNAEEGVAKPEEQESYFSDLTKRDLVNNLQSVSNIFYGDYNGNDGKGISDLLASNNQEALQAEIEANLKAAVEVVNALPESFTEAIQNNREQVAEAQNKVQALHDSFVKVLDLKF